MKSHLLTCERLHHLKQSRHQRSLLLTLVQEEQQQSQQESETDKGVNNTTDGEEAALHINSAS